MSETQCCPTSGRNRRLMVRYPSSRCAVVLLEHDVMQLGIDATLSDVSMTGLGLSVDTSLEVGQHVQVKLTNDVQRFQKVVRGIVRHVTAIQDCPCQVGIEIFNRLTPFELLTLKMGLFASRAKSSRKIWV